MTNPVLIVKQMTHGQTGEDLGRICWVWCPGCDKQHAFFIVSEAGVKPKPNCWTWDGNLEAPTFQASLLVYEIKHEDGTVYSPRCHSFVEAGQWKFLGDCGHALAGQTVPMVPVPDWLVH